MRNLSDYDFFIPSPIYRELIILKAFRNNKYISQPKLSKLVNVSLSRINSYVNELEKKGYISKENIKNKMIYLLLDKGRDRIIYLTLSLSHELFKFHNLIIGDYDDVFSKIKTKNVIIYGAGEVGQIVYHFMKLKKITVLDVVDDKLSGQRFFDLLINPLNSIVEHNNLDFTLIVASYKYDQEMIDKIYNINHSFNVFSLKAEVRNSEFI